MLTCEEKKPLLCWHKKLTIYAKNNIFGRLKKKTEITHSVYEQFLMSLRDSYESVTVCERQGKSVYSNDNKWRH